MALKTTILSSFSAEENALGDLRSGTIKTELSRLPRILLDGAGLNQANRLYSDTVTVAANTASTLDLFDFSGAKDAQGQSFALTKVKAIMVRNRGTDSTAVLRVGGEGSTAAFMAVNGSDTVHIADVAPGGELLLLAPSAAGYAVADTANHLLKFNNQSMSAALDFDVIIVGAQ